MTAISAQRTRKCRRRYLGRRQIAGLQRTGAVLRRRHRPESAGNCTCTEIRRLGTLIAQNGAGGLMRRSRSALVVAATPSLAMDVCAWLKLSGWQVVIARSYQAAKLQLEQRIELVVAELELGDYNGLQLALRAQSYDVPAVVIG